MASRSKTAWHDLGGWYLLPHRFTDDSKLCRYAKSSGQRTRFFGQGGGGIYGKDTTVHIIDCIISQNRSASGLGGGALIDGEGVWTFNNPQSVIFDNCTVSKNIGSGIVCFELSPAIIKDCTVIQNSGRGIVCTFFRTRNIHYQLPY